MRRAASLVVCAAGGARRARRARPAGAAWRQRRRRRRRRPARLGRLRPARAGRRLDRRSPRSRPTAATSRSRPAPATSSPTTIPTRPASTAPAASSASTSQTRALEKVADGDLFAKKETKATNSCAAAPRTRRSAPTAATSPSPPPSRSSPADTNDNVDVYVRDMAIPIGSPGRLRPRLGSRRRRRRRRATGRRPFPSPGSEPGRRRLARGGDLRRRPEGRRSAPTRPPTCRRAPAADVPAGQVFLRDRDADTTTLVTAKRDPGTGAMTAEPAGGALGAALSADGTTVAWTGGNAAAQTRFLGGENQDPSFLYYLWRRVADGPPRRRGGSPASPTPTTRPVRRGRHHDLRPDLDRALLRAAHRPGVEPRRDRLPAAGAERRRLHRRLPDRRRAAPGGLHRSRARPLRHRHDARAQPQGGDGRADPRHGRQRPGDQPAARQHRDVGERALPGADHGAHQIHPAGAAAARRTAAGARPPRAVRGRPPGAHARTGDPLLLRRRHRRRRPERRHASPPTARASPSPRSPATSSSATPTRRTDAFVATRRPDPAGGPPRDGACGGGPARDDRSRPRRPADRRPGEVEGRRGDRPDGVGPGRRRRQGGGESARRRAAQAPHPGHGERPGARERPQQRAPRPAPGPPLPRRAARAARRSPVASLVTYVASRGGRRASASARVVFRQDAARKQPFARSEK